MLLRLVHQTDLTYSALISESVMELRMIPRQEFDQHRLSFNLAIGPSTQVSSYIDWLGNTVHAFTVNAMHKRIRIVATSVVETDRPRKEVERFADTWPIAGHETDYSYYDFLQFGGPVVDTPQLRTFARILGAKAGMSLGELALRMLVLINERFTYRQGVTTFSSPITDLLENGEGVCQDFTHLMIGLGRTLGIPSRYVSGLVHPDAERFRGFTQTHAWCEMLFPSAGWVGFDPTNNCIIGPNFVKVAIGRDYRDVPPNRGVYRGKAIESIDVAVTSDELYVMPQELASDRVDPLKVETYDSDSTGHVEMANQQVEVQQQQQQQSMKWRPVVR